MALEDLQYIFYALAISGSLIGIITFIVSIWFNTHEDKKTFRNYSKKDKFRYYTTRANDLRLSKSIRNHAEKQLKRFK